MYNNKEERKEPHIGIKSTQDDLRSLINYMQAQQNSTPSQNPSDQKPPQPSPKKP